MIGACPRRRRRPRRPSMNRLFKAQALACSWWRLARMSAAAAPASPARRSAGNAETPATGDRFQAGSRADPAEPTASGLYPIGGQFSNRATGRRSCLPYVSSDGSPQYFISRTVLVRRRSRSCPMKLLRTANDRCLAPGVCSSRAGSSVGSSNHQIAITGGLSARELPEHAPR